MPITGAAEVGNVADKGPVRLGRCNRACVDHSNNFGVEGRGCDFCDILSRRGNDVVETVFIHFVSALTRYPEGDAHSELSSTVRYM